MDPTSFLSAILATMQAGRTWHQHRDRKQTEAIFNNAFGSASVDPAIRAQALELRAIVPQPVFDAITERTRKSWGMYLEVLRNPSRFHPAEVDIATIAVKTSITRELRQVLVLNDGLLPEGVLKDWWECYASAPRPARPIL